MKFKIFILISLTVTCLLFCTISCKEKFTEVVVSVFDDGFPQKILYYSVKKGDSVLIQSVEYHKSHNIFIKGGYKNGKRDGIWESWRENGNVWSIGYFQEGIQIKETLVYHENGNLYYSGHYDNQGNSVGVWKYYDEDNNLLKEIQR